MNKTNIWWREAEEKIKAEWDEYDNGVFRSLHSTIDFIETLLDQHSAHLVERIKKKKERAMFHPMRNQTGEAVYEYNMGYNDALDQAIDIIKDNK